MTTRAILFMTADPTDTSRLRLGQELREIQEKLQLSKHRKQFVLHERMSVRPADITQALLDINPQIVHFSGHGTGEGALCFENTLGEAHLIPPEALASLFEQFSRDVQCVILNACYSAAQAEAISRYIPFVIGMSQAIGDEAAISFSVGFYQALGAGRTIDEAFKLGCVQLQLGNFAGRPNPILVQKPSDAHNLGEFNPYLSQFSRDETPVKYPHELQPDGPSCGRLPRSPDVMSLIIQAGNEKEFGKKYELFQKAITCDPGDPVVYRLFAWASMKLNDYSKAIRSDWQAIALDRNYSKAYVGLIVSGNRTGDLTLVKEAWNKLQNVCDSRERPFHEAAYWYAEAQESFGNYREALQWYQHVVGNWWNPLSNYETRMLTDARERVNRLSKFSRQ